MNDSNENEKMNENEDESEKKDFVGKSLESVLGGIKGQSRFAFITKKNFSRETVAGIRDMNLGSIKNGKPIGKPVIRFDKGLPSKTTLNNLSPGQPIPPSKPHINIDPKGFSSAKNPHIYVNETVINGAQTFQKICEYAGPVLTVGAVAIEVWRLKSALSDDLEIKNNKDEIIKELKDAIRQLKNDLKTETDEETKKLIEKKLEECRKCLKEMKRNFPKTVKKGAEIAGGWTGGFAAGTAGSSAGFQIGATVGTFVGPAGTVVGGIAGALIGAIGAGIAGGYGGTCAAGYLAEKGMEYFDSDEDDEEDENENEKNKDDADEEDKKENDKNEDDEEKKDI
ncbi:uncharacterized protein LOC113796008 isoform X2 [Dermatophagoides pteronyssinus]|uniref:uncharacterized protein LOC113796008 isoform X2 n=1 Tax=Dermatophagoides pteronyssinus TaxID=6956 RepID=UPI003F67E128